MLKLKDREALKDWEAHKRSIERATIIAPDEPYAQKRERIEKLLASPTDFAQYYFPHYCQSGFADFQKRFFKNLTCNQRVYITNKWARDHAKSVTLIIAVIYLKQTKQARNLILASYNETNAVELLTPLKLEFETNLRLINDFGAQVNPGNWEAHKFVTLDGCSFRAIGAGQSPRGTRNQEARPDIIIVDDIDTEELCRNPKRLDELWEWVTGALYGCFSIQGRKRFVVVGNKIAKDSIVERAAQQSDFTEQVDILTKGPINKDLIKSTKAKLNDPGLSPADKKIWADVLSYVQDGYMPSWHQRFSMYDCLYMIRKMGYRMSQREYFNNPLVEGKVFKKAFIQYKELPAIKHYKHLLAYLDPGFKKTATSDSKSQVLVALYNGEFHIRKVFCGKASVEEMIEWGYEMDAFVKRNHGSYRFKMEEVFLQSLLYKDYSTAATKKGYPLPVSGDTRKKPDKDARIEAMSGYFERGSVFFDINIKEEHHTQALVDQLLNFEPGVKTLKDGPDALEGALFILQQSIRLNADMDVSHFNHNKHKF